MIAERSYMIPTASPRPSALGHVPSGCFQCDGSGHQLYRGKHRACRFCDGVATCGVYVTQLVTERFNYEASWHSPKFSQAVAHAHRSATLFAARLCMGYRVTEVRVIYKPAPSPVVREPEVLVASVPVGSREPVAA